MTETAPTPPSASAAATRRRILTVCLGNYCRSPLAAVVLAGRGGQAVVVRSAGLRTKWVGQPAHRDMLAAAAARGFDLYSHRGVHISPALMDWADLILAMDTAVLTELGTLADAHTATKLALYLGDRDVPDPFGHPYRAFVECVALIEAGVSRHLARPGPTTTLS